MRGATNFAENNTLGQYKSKKRTMKQIKFSQKQKYLKYKRVRFFVAQYNSIHIFKSVHSWIITLVFVDSEIQEH